MPTLRHIYDFKPFENEANILMSDPPNKEYQTYSMQEQKPVSGDIQNHLEYKQQETNFDSGYQEQNYDQQGYQQQNYSHQGYQQATYQHQPYQEAPHQPQQQQQQQPPPRPPGRVLPQQPETANPFRPQVQATGGNPFRQGF